MFKGESLLIQELHSIIENTPYSLEKNKDNFILKLNQNNNFYYEIACDNIIGWNVFIVPLIDDFDLLGEYEHMFLKLEHIVNKVNICFYYYTEEKNNLITKNLNILKSYLYENNSFEQLSYNNYDLTITLKLYNEQSKEKSVVKTGFCRDFDAWFLHYTNVDFTTKNNFYLIRCLQNLINKFNNENI